MFLAASLMSVASIAGASEATEMTNGSLALLSDSVYRGVSQTRGQPALHAGAYRELGSRWSVGVGLSTIDPGTWVDASFELNGSISHLWVFGEDWSANAAYVYYLYPDARSEYEYQEWIGSLTFRSRLTATIAFSPNISVYSYGYMTSEEPAVSYELSTVHPFGEHWSAVAGIGYYDLHEVVGAGYLYWSAGLLFSWRSFQLDVLRIDTDSTARQLFGSDRAGGRWSAALMWKF